MNWVEILSEFKKNNVIGVINSEILFEECWEDFLQYRIKADKKRPTKWLNEHLSLTFEAPGSPLMQKFNAFNIFRNGLYSIWEDSVWDEPAVIMSDLIGELGGFAEHQDSCPQIHLNCIGSTEWTIKKSNGEIIKKILNPGDIIYLPIKIFHGVKTIASPRVGIAYSIKQHDIL